MAECGGCSYSETVFLRKIATSQEKMLEMCFPTASSVGRKPAAGAGSQHAWTSFTFCGKGAPSLLISGINQSGSQEGEMDEMDNLSRTR